MNKNFKQNLNQEYTDFISGEEFTPSHESTNNIEALIKQDLQQSLISVLLKLLTIQIFVGLLTMTICPQFSLSFTGHDALFHFFHRNFGMQGCMIACGAFFVGSGAFLSNIFLTGTQLQKIHKFNILAYFCVSFLAVLIFSLFVNNLTQVTTLFWFIGAFVGGISAFEISRKIKFLILT